MIKGEHAIIVILIMLSTIFLSGCVSQNDQRLDMLEKENQKLKEQLEKSKDHSTSTPVQTTVVSEPVLIDSTQGTPIRATPSPTFTPENTKIFAIDIHHGGLHKNTITNYAKGKGWNIIEIDVEPLTNEYLKQKGVKILNVEYVTLPYTEKEIAEIKAFVEQGGGLFLQADRPDYELWGKELAQTFGVTITENNVPDNLLVSVSSDHPLMKNVGSFYILNSGYSIIFFEGKYESTFGGGPKYLNINPPSYSILNAGKTEPYYPVMAAAEYGKGRVLVYPFLFDDSLGKADNSNFLRNALSWLQGETVP